MLWYTMHHKLEVEDGTYGLLKGPNISKVRLGNHEMGTWYGTAVYFARDHKTLGFKYLNGEKQSRSKSLVNQEETWLEKLYVCDWCFKYTDVEDEFLGHHARCSHRARQPGQIRYLAADVTIRRVRGSRHKLFTQNLCLFTKMFLDNKSMFFAVDYFDFYVVYDNLTNKPMGFFSKELLSTDRNNLACILVFPPYQRRHLGTLLIAFSYELSKAERLISGPEKPLSPFGLMGYLKYWSSTVARELLYGRSSAEDEITLNALSRITGIRIDDITLTLKYMEIVKVENNKLHVDRGCLKSWARKNKLSKAPLLQKECLLVE